MKFADPKVPSSCAMEKEESSFVSLHPIYLEMRLDHAHLYRLLLHFLQFNLPYLYCRLKLRSLAANSIHKIMRYFSHYPSIRFQ